MDIKNLKAMLDNNIITKDEYNIIVNRLQPPKSVGDYLWSDIVDGYYKWCTDRYTETTSKGYKVCISKFVRYTTKCESMEQALNKKFEPFTYQTSSKFISSMFNDGLNHQTINKIKYALIVLIDYLKTLDIGVPDISGIKIENNQDANKTITAIKQDEIYSVVDVCDLRSKVIILLCYECALKRIELTRVRVQDFNFENRQLFVYTDDGSVIDRVCILSQRTISLVKEYIDKLYEDIDKWNKSRVGKGQEPRVDEGYIFQSVKTTTPSYTMIQTTLKKCAKTYYSKFYKDKELLRHIGNFTFENIRNSRRVYLLAQGKSVTQVMTLVGDKNYMATRKFSKLVPMLYPELSDVN